jgi:hypothetical protein
MCWGRPARCYARRVAQQRVDRLWWFAARFPPIRLLLALMAGSAAWIVWLRAPIGRVLLHATIAAAAWPVLEYLIHRFILHVRWPLIARANVHWRHHRAPNEPRLVFTPWWALATLVVATAVIGSTSEGQISAASAALGMSAVLLFYETTHLAAHVAYKPRTAWGAYMKRFHLWHHFQNENYWFGVTHPLGDWLAGTWKDHKAIEKSSTARGVDPESAPR